MLFLNKIIKNDKKNRNYIYSFYYVERVQELHRIIKVIIFPVTLMKKSQN